MVTTQLRSAYPGKHREACIFGPGFWKIRLQGGIELTYNTFEEAEDARFRLPADKVTGLSRDGYCLDPQDFPDVPQRQQTPVQAPVVDAETWLGMDKDEQMQCLGITDESTYDRTLAAATEMVSVAVNRLQQTGVRVSVVLKRKGIRVVDL